MEQQNIYFRFQGDAFLGKNLHSIFWGSFFGDKSFAFAIHN
uniref:Uncharacterized protein n=1 Tax=Anguilla anguilla TaxID=7936 RepID=A0A0E9TUF8_ANGAN